jgi:hypothetical protein
LIDITEISTGEDRDYFGKSIHIIILEDLISFAEGFIPSNDTEDVVSNHEVLDSYRTIDVS